MFEYLEKAISWPGAIRFIVQPIIAILLGIRDGLKDAKSGKLPFIYLLIYEPKKRLTTMKEGLKHIITALLIATVLDSIVQYSIYGLWRLQWAIVVGILLIALPYMTARGISNRIRSIWRKKPNI